MATSSTPAADEFPAIAGNLYAPYAIANDAIARPQLYVSDNLPDELTALRFSYGTVRWTPNVRQPEPCLKV